ncbi:hypothetical protein CDEST_00567 [Colletotrichum destructivum]|uniref:Uncharacterized protein n=1 Tax=Colletotrichum destructivum TaxID=34406 RepID=A0AAX4HXH8_9PEZI|nr:hypothetical protein CDEST_00567 [Colletotrichum destructivum]
MFVDQQKKQRREQRMEKAPVGLTPYGRATEGQEPRVRIIGQRFQDQNRMFIDNIIAASSLGYRVLST